MPFPNGNQTRTGALGHPFVAKAVELIGAARLAQIVGRSTALW